MKAPMNYRKVREVEESKAPNNKQESGREADLRGNSWENSIGM